MKPRRHGEDESCHAADALNSAGTMRQQRFRLHRVLLSVAIAIFLVASVGCAVALPMQLIAARICQGLGGGGLISLAQTIIPQVDSLRERGRIRAT